MPPARHRHYDIPGFKMRMRGRAPALLVIACCVAAGCRTRTSTPGLTGSTGLPTASTDWFSDMAEASGLRFTHVNGMSGDLTMPEILGPGVALFDYDNDGDLDVFVLQGQPLGRNGSGQPSQAPRGTLDGPALSKRPRRSSRRHADAALHGRDGAERHHRDRLRHGRGDGRLRQRRLRRSLSHQLRREPAASTTTAMAPSPTSRRRAARPRAAGACRRLSSTTIATDGSTSTWAATCATPSRAPRSASARLARATTARRTATSRFPDGCSTTTATARFPTRPRRAESPASSGRHSASPRRTSTATAGSTSTSPTTASRTSCGSTSTTGRSGTRRCSRAPRSRRKARPRRAWAWMPATSTTTATTICS